MPPKPDPQAITPAPGLPEMGSPEFWEMVEKFNRVGLAPVVGTINVDDDDTDLDTALEIGCSK